MTNKKQSLITNCEITPREGESPFTYLGDRNWLVKLDGYVIMPKEQFKDYIHKSKLLDKEKIAETLFEADKLDNNGRRDKTKWEVLEENTMTKHQYRMLAQSIIKRLVENMEEK